MFTDSGSRRSAAPLLRVEPALPEGTGPSRAGRRGRSFLQFVPVVSDEAPMEELNKDDGMEIEVRSEESAGSREGFHHL